MERLVICTSNTLKGWRQALDMRMPGVVDILRAEAEEAHEPRDELMGEPEAEGHHFQQQGGFHDWGSMRSYLDDQENMRHAREQSLKEYYDAKEQARWQEQRTYDDNRWGDVWDAFEEVRDIQNYHSARFTQLELWTSQPEPRQFVPVSDDYQANLDSRSAARRERQIARWGRDMGPSGSGQ